MASEKAQVCLVENKSVDYYVSIFELRLLFHFIT